MRPRRSLLTRIALALAVVGLVPLGLAAYRLVDLNRDAMWDQVLHTHAVTASTVAGRVGAYVATRRNLGSALAADEDLAADPRSARAAGRLSSLLASWPDLSAVAVLGPDGGEVVRAQRRELGEEVSRILAAPGGAGGLVSETAAGHTWIRIDTPWPSGGGELRLVWSAEQVVEILDPFAIGEEAALALATQDRDGASRQLAGSASLGAFPRDLVARAASGEVAGAGAYEDAVGDTVLAAYDAVPGTSWFVLSRQPASVANQNALAMRRGAWLAVGLALVLTIALSGVAYISLVRPIREIAAVQRRLAGVTETPAKGNEIDQLKASFAALERRLRDQEAMEQIFLGRYQVHEVLGEGAMGMVFRGWDPKLQRPIALKTIHFDRDDLKSQAAELSGRLVHEAVTAARFSHPNIVAIYDAEDTPEAAYVAMELIDGPSLDRYLWRNQKLEPGQVARIGAAVASGLDAAHRHGVVHQDIKPANVMLGSDGQVKVTDFGISRAISAVLADQEKVFGTPGYLPPEALRGEGSDQRADLFALGVTLYEALVGVPPFDGPSLKAVIQKTLSGRVQPPQELDPAIPPELGNLVLSLLEREPQNRPANAAAVAQRFEAIAYKLDCTWPPALAPGESATGLSTRILGSQIMATQATGASASRRVGSAIT